MQSGNVAETFICSWNRAVLLAGSMDLRSVWEKLTNDEKMIIVLSAVFVLTLILSIILTAVGILKKHQTQEYR